MEDVRSVAEQRDMCICVCVGGGTTFTLLKLSLDCKPVLFPSCINAFFLVSFRSLAKECHTQMLMYQEQASWSDMSCSVLSSHSKSLNQCGASKCPLFFCTLLPRNTSFVVPHYTCARRPDVKWCKLAQPSFKIVA